MTDRAPGVAVGDEVEVVVGAVAHGGHCVARYEGQVVFVRHALPGELVRARVTELGGGSRFVRADAVEVLTASPDRTTPPCPWSGPGRCGGCDLQHVARPRQRELKADVVREQLARLAGLEVAVVVEPVTGDADGLGWRTRVEYAVDASGRAGLRRHRSHEVVRIDHCRIASEGVAGLDVTRREWPGSEAVDAVAPATGAPVAVPVGPRGSVPEDVPDVVERVEASWAGADGGGRLARDFGVAARGFWQVHPGAAATFVGAVMAGLDVRPGERALDLYSGVGLFSAALGEAVGPAGQVVAVEADRDATEHAERNLADLPWVLPVRARVDDAFGVPRRTSRGRRPHRGRRPVRSPMMPTRADVVVLDPPRTGAGPDVVREVAALGPRAVAYVACDPAALARDTRTLTEAGYRLASLRAFDAFPMTHHVECVAHLVPS
ncbi:class I SAM-dependent RNA methyltransferase [Phycicoccus sp. CSK15P-2]|uniref:class I SAM-dependent RNA methyltransferase n=1 Tax=Phycicoccus sp. CSK15P-2 TaxID=2807627 RepID=UPI0019517844|nr:class I SAM-dependent RNA methyltransferase [Phycicoccus sp. CSK15P-2]MBM6403985.1 class I SAM-dependent RNA methyltransferase [Phycicoccus sp. CSK15P-2]